jgi:hypothetical protein
MTTEGWNAWNFRDRPGMDVEGRNLVGFEVHATDGHIGKIDEATTEVDKSRIVVDTGHGSSAAKCHCPFDAPVRGPGRRRS